MESDLKVLIIIFLAIPADHFTINVAGFVMYCIVRTSGQLSHRTFMRRRQRAKW